MNPPTTPSRPLRVLTGDGPMSGQQRVELASGLAAAAAVLIRLLQVDNTLAGLVVLGFLLLGPGAAISLVGGTVSFEGRALVTVVGGATVSTLVALTLIYADVWSMDVGVGVVATITLVVIVVRRRQAGTPSATKSGRASRTSSTEYPT
jgi:hypothetical protein